LVLLDSHSELGQRGGKLKYSRNSTYFAEKCMPPLLGPTPVRCPHIW
jgi:hypothetical protein